MNIQSKLSSELKISRIITGLWQIADMERKGVVDPKKYAKKIIPYVESGFTTFDMADHYGSSELIIGEYKRELSNVELTTSVCSSPPVKV